MKRVFPLIFLLVGTLAGCSLFSSSGEHTFDSDYKKSVQYALSSDMKLSQKLLDLNEKWYPSGFDTSWIRFAFDIQKQASGSLFLSADAIRETYNKISAKLAFSGVVELPTGQISHAQTKGEITTDSMVGKYYGKLDEFLFDGIFSEGMPTAQDVAPYIGKWYLFDYYDAVIASAKQGMKSDDSSKMMMRVVQSEIQLISDIQLNGLKNISELIQSHPIFVPTGSGTIKGDTMIYPVALSQTGIIDFTDAFLVRYAGSGLTSDEKQKMQSDLNDVSFQGEFSVAQGDTAYSTLSGTVITQTKSGARISENIMIAFQKDTTQFSFASQSGGLVSVLNRGNGDDWQYTLDITENGKQNRFIDAGYSSKKDDNHLKIALTPPTESGGMLEVRWSDEQFGKFSGYIGDIPKENYFEISGTREKDITRTMSGKFVTQSELPNEMMNFSYVRDEKDDYHGELVIPKTQIEFSGRAKKDDFLFETVVQGMSVKVENKKINDTDWQGLVQIPVAKLDWQSTIDQETLKSLRINMTSPFVTAKIDMKNDGEWARGPYVISSQGEVVSSGKIGLMKKPKYFGIRLETILPTLASTEASFFEFVGMSDIKWDKDAKVEIPVQAETLDMNKIIPKLQSASSQKSQNRMTDDFSDF